MTFKELRKRSGMTQKAFAEYFNISRRNIESWDTDYRTPPGYLLELMEYKLRKEGIIEREDDDNLQKLLDLFDSWNLKEYIPFHTERAMLADYLLQNGVNFGERVDVDKGASRAKPEAEKPDAIIDQKTWEAVQTKLRERKEQPAPPNGYKWEGDKLVIDESEAAKIKKGIDDFLKK